MGGGNMKTWMDDKLDEEAEVKAQESVPIVAGVKYDAGKPRMDLISPFAMEELGKVLAYGAKKYADRNWEKGISYSRVIAAILRHTAKYMMGEKIDPETGLSHMAAVLCNAHFLVHFENTMPSMDDLPKYEVKR